MFKTKLLNWFVKAADVVADWVNFTRVMALTILVCFSLTSIASGYTDYEKREMDKNSAQAVTPVGSASTNMNEMYHTGGMQTYKDGNNTYFMKNGQVQKIEHGTGESAVTETIDHTDPKKDMHKFYNSKGEEVKDEKGTSKNESSEVISNKETVKEAVKDSVKQPSKKESQQILNTNNESSQENKKSEASSIQGGKTSQNAVVSAKVDTQKESVSDKKNSSGAQSTKTKNKIDDTSGISKEGLLAQAGGLNSLIDKAKSITTQMFANIINLVSGENRKSDTVSAEVSMEEIQKIAKDNGVDLNATKTDYEGLKESIKSSPAITHLRAESKTSKGSFIVVTAVDDNQVTYIGSNGATRNSVSKSEFNEKWDGKVLTTQQSSSELSISDKKNTRGTFVSKVLGSIREVFSQKTSAKNMSKFLAVYASGTDKQKEKLAAKYGVSTKQLENMMKSFVTEYKNASSAKKSAMARYAGVSSETLNKIYTQTVAQIATNATSQPVAATATSGTTSNTAQPTATTSQQDATAATTAVTSGNFLNSIRQNRGNIRFFGFDRTIITGLRNYESANSAKKKAKIAQKYGINEASVKSFIEEYRTASPEKRKLMARIAGVNIKKLDNIYQQALRAFPSAISTSVATKGTSGTTTNTVATSKSATTVTNVTSQQPTAQTAQNATTSQQDATAATTALSSITTFLNEYVIATPARQAEMAATLGLTSDQLVTITADSATQIINYLNAQGANIINCAVNSLSQMFGASGNTLNKADIATQVLLIDILTGNLDTSNSSAQVQTSAFAIQQTAKINGVELTGYNTTTAGLDQSLSGGNSAIINLNLGGGVGHYVTLTSGANGSYQGSDGNTYNISADNSVSYTTASGATQSATWTGNMLSKDPVTVEGTTVLSSTELKTIKGSQTVDQANASVDTANAGLTAAQSGLTAAQTDVTTTQAALTAAQTEVTTAQTALTAAQTALAAAQAEVTTTQAEVTAAQNAEQPRKLNIQLHKMQ